MTPTQLEHLKRIDAHLERLLDIASKRTPGEWSHHKTNYAIHGFDGGFICKTEYGDKDAATRRQENATFIAACAGNAEAGWRAVRAAIKNGTSALNELGVPQPGYPAPVANAVEFITQQLESILAAFPLETLK